MSGHTERAADPEYWNPLVPELTVGSLESSLRFYRAAGFSIRFRRESPPFAYIELGGAQMMLEEQHEEGWEVAPLIRPLGRGVNFQIEVQSVQSIWLALEALDVSAFRDVRETWYAVGPDREEGQREFLVQDPDGYLLRFSEPLGGRDKA